MDVALTACNYELFRLVEQYGEVSARMAAEHLDIKIRSASERLNRMKTWGVITSHPDVTDNRVMLYSVVPGATVTDGERVVDIEACDCSGDSELHPVTHRVMVPAPTPSLWVDAGIKPTVWQGKPVIFRLCADCAEWEREMHIPGVVIQPLGTN